jgi:hypothetical protein
MTVQFEILSIKFYENAEFGFSGVFFLAMLLAYRTLYCFGEKEHMSLLKCLQSCINVQENMFP